MDGWMEELKLFLSSKKKNTLQFNWLNQNFESAINKCIFSETSIFCLLILRERNCKIEKNKKWWLSKQKSLTEVGLGKKVIYSYIYLLIIGSSN